MKSQIDEFLGRFLSRWVDAVRARAKAVVVSILALSLALLVYVALNLGVNSDNLSLVSEDLLSRKAAEEFSSLFPNLDSALLIVIDADTPERARQAVDALAANLKARDAHFTDVYVPGGGTFFERNGLLYRSVEELDLFGDQMARVQPLIAELERDPSIARLSTLVRQGLDVARRDGRGGEEWSSVLDRMSHATVQVYEEFPLEISWEEILLRDSPIEVVTRRVLIAHPVLDFRSLLAARQALAEIRGAAAELSLDPDHGVRVRITGNPALNYEEMIGLAWDIGGAGLFCFGLVALLLYRALRSLQLMAAAIATLLVGLIWTAAFATLAVGELNLISIAFAILFIGLGVDFGIHLGMRYGDLLRRGAPHERALSEAASEVGASLVFCSVTTAIGFFVFVPTEYRGVAELGLIAGAGMFIILFQTLTFFPALLSCWLRIDPARQLGRQLHFRHAWWAPFARHPRRVRWVALVAGLGGLLLLPRAHFDADVVDMRDATTESVQAFNDLLDQAGASSPWYINALAKDLDAAVLLSQRLRQLDVVDRAISLVDYVPDEQEEKREILLDVFMLLDSPRGPAEPAPGPSIEEQVSALRDLHEFLDAPWIQGDSSRLGKSMIALHGELGRFLERVEREGNAEQALDTLEDILLSGLPRQLERLRTALDASTVTLDDLPAGLVSRMLAADGRARVQIFPSENLSARDGLERFVSAVLELAPRATGVVVNLIAFKDATVRSFQQALISAVLVIALFLWTLWQRASDTLLVLAPLLLSAVLTGAAMVLLGLSFNFANVVVLPLLFGIGVDSGIHLVHRARLPIPEGEGLLGTTTARAVYYSALTTVASFGTLSFSSHSGMSSLGVMLMIGMTLTVICNLVVLPALISLRDELAGRPRA
ncbi:MAG: MMPL family transporter [Myxococcota bacterium]